MGQLHPCQCRSHPGDDQSFRSLAHNGRRQWPSVRGPLTRPCCVHPQPTRASHNSLICLPEIARKPLDFGERHGETIGIKVEGKNPFAQTFQTNILTNH